MEQMESMVSMGYQLTSWPLQQIQLLEHKLLGSLLYKELMELMELMEPMVLTEPMERTELMEPMVHLLMN